MKFIGDWRSKKGFIKKVQSWMPVSLLNTYEMHMVRQRGKHNWKTRIMYEELYYRLLVCKGNSVRGNE
ncbi:MAG: hypothetical protein V3U54_08665 [Thermodesulfobacteriota bacterium]